MHIGSLTVDFIWREARLVAELDGWESHRTRSAFEADRARDVRLKSRGFEVVRFTYRQIAGDPGGVVAVLRAVLA